MLRWVRAHVCARSLALTTRRAREGAGGAMPPCARAPSRVAQAAPFPRRPVTATATAAASGARWRRRRRQRRSRAACSSAYKRGLEASPPPGSTEVIPGLGRDSPHWSLTHAYLRERGVRALAPADAWAAMQHGATLVDVRFGPDFDEWRVPGAVSVPYTYSTPLRRLLGLSLWEFGIPIGLRGGVKLRDPNFTRGALAALPDTRAPLILADQLGGSLVRDAVPLGGSYGIMLDSTRSQALMAAYELSQVGYEDLAYVEGGFNDWYEEAALGGELPAGEGRWPGDKEWFGYRQFRGNDPRKGYR